MTQYADSGDYTWPLADNEFDHVVGNPPYQLDIERLSELVSGGGALLDVPPVKPKDASNTVFVPFGDNVGIDNTGNGYGDFYDTRTCNDRHTEEMGRLWEAIVDLTIRVKELEAINTPGK